MLTSQKDRCLGAFIGLAVGDAMGAPVEFSEPGEFEPVTGYRSGGPFNLPAGYWTDDTSMALCLADSLLFNRGQMSLKDQLTRYSNWHYYGYNSSTGKCFDIGQGTVRAIHTFQWEGRISSNTFSEGNGSLMRLAPVPIVFRKNMEVARENSELQSITTHNANASKLAGEFGEILHSAISGNPKESLLPSFPIFLEVVTNSGHAPESFRAALHHFHSTNSFSEAILQAVNYGGDSDTIGAITGQLAGAYYGLSGIPEEWVSDLHDTLRLQRVAENLYDLSEHLS